MPPWNARPSGSVRATCLRARTPGEFFAHEKKGENAQYAGNNRNQKDTGEIVAPRNKKHIREDHADGRARAIEGAVQAERAAALFGS